MGDPTPDSESLMALHALLKIRSDSIMEAAQFCVTSRNDTLSFRPTAEDSAASQRSNDTTRAQAFAPKPTALAPSVTLNAHPVPPSPPSFTPMVRPPPLALAPSLSLNCSIPQNAKLTPVPFYPTATEPIKPMATTSSTLQSSDLKRIEEAAKEEQESPAAKAIRTAEIEAALRSKPQRGRKRDNLSALERLELTRTRNREHAKSTRVRKKARYQELLDNEQKYEEMMQIQDLRMQREECIHCFLSIREAMLRSCLAEQEPCTDSTGEPDEARVQGFVSPPHRVVTFLESNPSSRDGSRAHSPREVAERAESLSELMNSDTDFEFKVVGGATVDASSVGSDQGASRPLATSAMAMFDRSLAAKVEETMGKSAVGNLSYTLANGGVAVNDCGTGFAQVLVTTHMSQKTVMTGIVKIQFAPDSAKLRSVVWHITEEGSDEHAHDQDAESESSNESLGCQTSYPSVVSLDPGGDLSAEKLRAAVAGAMDDPGPGMHI